MAAVEHVFSSFKRVFCQLIGLGGNSIKSDYFEEDCITQLPDEMLALILSNLTFKEVVKTRVLGRRWRHLHLSQLYSSRSNLNFDSAWAGVGRCVCEKYACAFVKDVNEFLNQYKGPYVSSFAVDFCLSRMFSSDIDRWITYAVKLGAKELKICCKCTGVASRNRHRLYSFSFQHLAKAYELKRLKLKTCILKPDFDGQFHSLKFLELSDITLDQSILLYILSRFCSLEELSLFTCPCPAILSFRAPFSRLKTLYLYFCRGLEEIDISSTSLTSLYVDSMYANFNIVFSTAPNLVNLYLCQLGYKTRFLSDLFNMIEDGALQLQTLAVQCEIIMVKSMPNRIRTFHNLKHMELFLIASNDPYDIRKIIPLIVACPILETFTLSIAQVDHLGMASHFEIRTAEISECCLPHLKEVELFGFQATETQLELALYLLRNGVALERMVITPCRKYKDYRKVSYEENPREPWTNNMRQKIVERLQGNAASESAQLSIYDC